MQAYSKIIHIAKNIGVHNEQLRQEAALLGIKNTNSNKINEIVITKTLHDYGIPITHSGNNFGPDATMVDGGRVEIKTTSLRKDLKIRPSDSVAVFGQQYLHENRVNAISYDSYVFGIVDHIKFEPVPLIILFSSKPVVIKLKSFISRMQNNFLKNAEVYYNEHGAHPRYDGVGISLIQVLSAVDWQPDLFILNNNVVTNIKQVVQHRKSILLEY